MNKVILVGYITKKPELKYVNNLAITTFTIAVNRQKEGADFIGITVFNKQAENIEKYCDKGSLVSVEGRVQVSSYKKEDKTLYKTEIIADSIRFLSSKGNTTKTEENTQEAPKNKLEQNVKELDLGW